MGYTKILLSQSAFWQVNKLLTMKLNSIEAALFFSDLVDKEFYYESRDELIEINGKFYFYATSDQIKDNTTLTYKVQKKCIKILLDSELIETKLMGMPARLHFTICSDKLDQLFKTSIAEKSKQVLPKREVNNNRVNNNKEIINTIKQNSQKTLFDIPDINAELEFIDSPVYEKSVWNALLKDQKVQGIDIDYYYNAVMDWAEKLQKKDKRKKKTVRGWIAEARSFMRGDNDKNKLKTIGGTHQALSQEQLFYLNL